MRLTTSTATSGNPPKVAFVIAGAAALGPFEGGAAYEFLYAIRQARGNKASPPLIPDVFVGTSAGALTSLLAVHSLVTGSPIEDIHDAWVKGAGAGRLTGAVPGRRRSILSGAAVGELVDEWLRPAPAGATPMAAGPVRLVATLTNLDGLRFRFGTSGDPPSIETVAHQDLKAFDLDPKAPHDSGLWSAIGRAVVASGAFPIAFEPVPIEHTPEELEARVPGRYVGGGQRRFWCSDGGVLEGMPLGRAIDAVADLDAADPSGREFIVIEPGDPGDQASGPPGPEGYSPASIMARLATIPITEQVSRDLVQFEKTNARLAAIEEAWVDWARIVTALDAGAAEEAVLDLAAACRRHWPDTDDRIARMAADQEAHGWPPAMTSSTPAHRRLFLLLRLRLEGASGLAGKRRYRLHHLAPSDPGELAGAFWGHFGGLFEEKFREHDFRVGRRVARDWLLRNDPSYTPAPEAEYAVEDLRPRGWQDLSLAGKWQAVKVIGNTVDLILDQLHGAGWGAVLGASAVAAYRGLSYPMRRAGANVATALGRRDRRG
ncbi:MAG: patatin-like phospholipase family protein [Bacillota bacterium]